MNESDALVGLIRRIVLEETKKSNKDYEYFRKHFWAGEVATVDSSTNTATITLPNQTTATSAKANKTGQTLEIGDKVYLYSPYGTLGSSYISVVLKQYSEGGTGANLGIIDALRTVDDAYDSEVQQYQEIESDTSTYISAERLYWTDATLTTKDTTLTIYPTRQLQQKSISRNEALFVQGTEDDMTTTVTDWPVYVHTKDVSDNPLYYTDETTAAQSITPTLVNIPTPDLFADEDYYLPIVTQYQIGVDNAYWATKPILSTTQTDYPAMQEQYARYQKYERTYSGSGLTGYVVDQWGFGTDLDAGTKNGIGYQYKSADEFVLEYFNQLNEARRAVVMSEDDINHVVGTEIAKNVFTQDAEPLGVASGSIHVDTDDYTRYDYIDVTSTYTLDVNDGEIAFCDGTFTLTMFELAALSGTPSNGSIFMQVVNVGAGTITVSGFAAGVTETINGSANITLTSGQAAFMWSRGGVWIARVV